MTDKDAAAPAASPAVMASKPKVDVVKRGKLSAHGTPAEVAEASCSDDKKPPETGVTSFGRGVL